MSMQRMLKPAEAVHVEAPRVEVGGTQIHVDPVTIPVTLPVHIDGIEIRSDVAAPQVTVGAPHIDVHGVAFHFYLPAPPDNFYKRIIIVLSSIPLVILANHIISLVL